MRDPSKEVREAYPISEPPIPANRSEANLLPA